MKTCKNARNCQWGSSIKANSCAYKENMNEYDSCPKIFENWENMIEELQNKEPTYYIQGIAQKVSRE